MKIKRSIPVVETREDADEIIAQIHAKQEENIILHAEHLEEIKKLKEELKRKEGAFEARVKESKQSLTDLILGLYRFAKENRPELTGGTQTAKFPQGSMVRWLGTSRIAITDPVLAKKFVEENQLIKFFRKEIILKKKEMNSHWDEAKAIPGIERKQGENFLIYPKGVKKPISERVSSLEAALSPKARKLKPSVLTSAT
jgi:phage host-nuclease inhibitor protein Gam